MNEKHNPDEILKDLLPELFIYLAVQRFAGGPVKNQHADPSPWKLDTVNKQ